jgi:hypothetical protein
MVLDFNPSPVTAELELIHQDGTFTALSSNSNLWFLGSQLVVADLNGNSQLQTLGYGIDYTDSLAYVSAWQTDGTQLNSSFPLKLAFQNSNDGRLNRNPVLVGDIDGDGKNEIIAMEDLSATTFTLALFANDGSPLIWQVPALPGVPVVMAAADLDNNGKLETVVAANSDTQTFLHVFQPDGSERRGWPLTLYNSNINSQSYLAVADLNLDGHKEIVYSHESFLYVFNQDASNFSSAWPLQASPVSESFGYNAVAIGDVDGDGFPEIVTVLNTLASNTDPYFALGSYAHQQLLAIRRDGTISKSWELTAGNGCWLQFYPTPAIGDFDQDGITDIAVALEVGAGACSASTPGVVTLLSTGTKFNPGLNDWPLTRHDPRATSVLQCSDFCLTANSAPPINAGSPATYTLTAAPNDFPYTTAVSNFTCSGLPIGASCNFSPSSVTPGLAPASATLIINTTSRSVATNLPGFTSPPLPFSSTLSVALCSLFAVPLLLATHHRSLPRTAFLFLFLVFASALVLSCGSNSATAPPPNGTPAGAYTITVSATGASQIPKTANLSLTVN